MIVGSLLLIVVAVGLLVVGLLQGANALLVASIAASLLAAVALILGGRQVAAARRTAAAQTRSRSGAGDRVRAARDLEEVPVARREPVGAGVGVGSGLYGQAAADETSMMSPVRESPVHHEEPYPSVPHQSYGMGAALDDDDDDDDYDDEDEPEDEPAPQITTAADRARVSQLTSDVYVVDGRPRYHLRECVHLLGRENEPLPVGEANELGFTPCGACEPDATLIAAARRR